MIDLPSDADVQTNFDSMYDITTSLHFYPAR